MLQPITASCCSDNNAATIVHVRRISGELQQLRRTTVTATVARIFSVAMVAAIVYRVGQKSKPDNFCNNFVYCQPIFVIFGTDTL